MYVKPCPWCEWVEVRVEYTELFVDTDQHELKMHARARCKGCGATAPDITIVADAYLHFDKTNARYSAVCEWNNRPREVSIVESATVSTTAAVIELIQEQRLQRFEALRQEASRL